MSGGPAGVDTALLEEVTARFATGVTVVTTGDPGAAHALTVTAFTSVSLDPPLVMFCVPEESPFGAALRGSGVWAVSVLAEGQRAAAERFAPGGRIGRTGPAGPGGPAHEPGPATGAALLSGAVAVLECRTHSILDGGDHRIVVGEVLALDAPDVQGGPLVRYAGGYRSFG